MGKSGPGEGRLFTRAAPALRRIAAEGAQAGGIVGVVAPGAAELLGLRRRRTAGAIGASVQDSAEKQRAGGSRDACLIDGY